MLQSKARWKINKADEDKVNELSEQLNISKIASRFLIQRGFTNVDDARDFLHTDESSVHDPFLLKDMEKAISRIKAGIESGENILVFGDYDADGVTSTSLLYLTLRELGANVGYYVPNRFTEGYGPNEQAFRHAKEENVSLIITVDTGISAVHEAEVAKELEVDLIITDHHEPPPQIPDAYAVINPKQEDCYYPNPNLAGVGVAFKVAHALLDRYPQEYVDLVAMGTIADLVPLKGENRFLAKAGIQTLMEYQRPGIKALFEQCGIQGQEMSEEQIGFMIGPRLNAAGRLDSADPAIQLIISEDEMEAYELALIIDDLNKERQQIVNDMTKEAEEQVDSFDELPPVLIVGKEDWNAGVIGIVASRLVEKYYRPTIVLSINSDTGLAKGSARSIEGFDMFQSLSKCREWLPHFGGHPMAAGLTMKIEHIDLLQKKLGEIADETLSEEDWQRSLSVDLPVEFSEISIESIGELQAMAPFGVGNPAPKVLLEQVEFSLIKKIGAKEDHLKLGLKKGDDILDGIGFRMGTLHNELSPLASASIVGQLSINEWNGHCKPQIIIEDLKVEEWQLFDLRGETDPIKKLLAYQHLEMTVIIFREETKNFTISVPEGWTVIQYRNLNSSTIDLHNKNLLFLDLPENKEQIIQILDVERKPSRIYISFLHEKDHFFEMLPTREHFKWFYAFIYKRKTFDMNRHAIDLAKHKGWTVDAVHFISQVFFDLGFVKIDNGIVTLVENPAKKDLTDSLTYRQRIEQSELENELIYSSYEDVKEWFSKMMKEKALVEH
ncbi:single-stranded-DNA-specific exonuclease [Evansella vedderi]|uniref:Single-stranded-DNA-specific exonuclease RecJ n=1 Tax=Evansella vedderi TaxID=38282 RepID=A0ABT9ZUX9_9BACI|nr:single-stranded-DNA-specific exonuclease RecJ [Evansella vedderi]MDQ0254258.1 single-stranded-DNA-specific exonuclease [Evansella vedderi]